MIRILETKNQSVVVVKEGRKQGRNWGGNERTNKCKSRKWRRSGFSLLLLNPCIILYYLHVDVHNERFMKVRRTKMKTMKMKMTKSSYQPFLLFPPVSIHPWSGWGICSCLRCAGESSVRGLGAHEASWLWDHLLLGTGNPFKIMSWNTGVIYIVLFVTPFFFLRGYIWCIYIYTFVGDIWAHLVLEFHDLWEIWTNLLPGLMCWLHRRMALACFWASARRFQLRGYVEREVFPWIQICGNLEFPAGLGKLCWFVRFVSPFPLFPESFFFLLGASSTGLASWPIQIRFMVLSWATEVEATLVGFFRWGFGGRAKPGESPQEAVRLVRFLGNARCRGSNCQYGRLQHVWCEGSSVFHFQLHVLRLGCIFFWKKLYHVI